MSVQITSVDEIDYSQPFVIFGECPEYPYQLTVEGSDTRGLISDYPEYISDFSVLVETGLFDYFTEILEKDGYSVYLLDSAMKVIDKHHEWSKPIEIEGLTLPSIGDKEGGLFPYQQYAIRKALEGNFLFFNHDTGTGKSITAAGGAQELFNRGQIDVVLFFTLRKNKINMMRAFNKTTKLRAVNIEGTKARRERMFKNEPADVYVMNYEKANFDFDILKERIGGLRVLFVLDEVQKILIHGKGNKPNKAGQGIKELIKVSGKDSHVWPMSATAINADPERYHHLFDKIPGKKNPLGSLTSYRTKYVKEEVYVRSGWGGEIKRIWNTFKIKEVRHVIAPYTHAVRKSDPGVREYFKETRLVPIPIQLSDEERGLYDLVKEIGSDDDPDLWGQYYRVLKYICNTTSTLAHSESAIAKAIVESVPDLEKIESSKMETLVDQLEEIRDQGDKVVVFSQYTNMGVFRISEALKKAKIKHVVHYGTGMTDKAAQMAQDEFKSDPSVTVFLSSDAGSHGLSFQEARYVIHFDFGQSYDLFKQRSDRIDRADSYLDGLTSYVYICEDTAEERSWKILNDRKKMGANIQGTIEEVARAELEG